MTGSEEETMTDHKHVPACSVPGADTCPEHHEAARQERIRTMFAESLASFLDDEQGIAEATEVTEADQRVADRLLASPAIALVKAAALDEAYGIACKRGLYETGIDLLARAAEYEAEAAR